MSEKLTPYSERQQKLQKVNKLLSHLVANHNAMLDNSAHILSPNLDSLPTKIQDEIISGLGTQLAGSMASLRRSTRKHDSDAIEAIMRSYYGFGEKRSMTQSEIAHKMKITKSRVAQRIGQGTRFMIAYSRNDEEGKQVWADILLLCSTSSI